MYNSLKQLLDYKEQDIEDVFMQTFRISYQDVFGSTMHYDLKENGDQINVTQENKYVSFKTYVLGMFYLIIFCRNLLTCTQTFY